MKQAYTLSQAEVQAAVQLYATKVHKVRGLTVESVSSTEDGGVTFTGTVVPQKRAPRKPKAEGETAAAPAKKTKKAAA